MGNAVDKARRAWAVALSSACICWVCACNVYDPHLPNGPADKSDGGAEYIDGGDKLPDASARADASMVIPDAGAADGGDAGAADAAAGRCRENPADKDGSCPEICPEICNGKDDDCDGHTDEAADGTCAAPNAEAICQGGECFLTGCRADHRDCDQLAMTGCEVAANDPKNCGSCGRACDIANATPACENSVCVVEHCGAGYADCDADRLSCETQLNTLSNCGGCGTTCGNVPHAAASCAGGSCGVASCDPGYGDCDNRADNGCEQKLDTLQHCAGCNLPCSKASCGGGFCTAADCNLTPGFADCDHDEASCETDLHSDLNNCGTCGHKCQFASGVSAHATLSCSVTGCGAVCDAGYGDCDGNYANGCEQPLNTLAHCGACGRTCAIGNANATCSTGSCSVQTCKADFADCDSDQLSCETALNTPSHCGTCMTVCNLPNANEGCAGSAGAHTCSVASCDAGWADCDGTAANGCERDIHAVGSGGLGPCLPDASCSKASTAGHDYYFCPIARTWSDARSKCQLQLQGDLAHINDATEDAFIKAHISASNWVGSTDAAIEGLWTWADNRVPFWRGTAGGTALNSLYVNWASGEPNGSGNCGQFYTSGQFDDADCASMLPFVCEVSPDACTNDATKLDPGQCGCGMPDSDSDNDGFANCNDACPNDANKQAAGACGCGVADADADGDGVLNCNDGCPNDGAKTAPGSCGCGVSDADTDNDGTRDCNETCDTDPAKTAPGVCGCNVADTDSDADGTPNCMDGCPADPGTGGACFPFAQSNFTTGSINFTAAPSSTLNCGTTTVNTSTTPATLTNWCGTQPVPLVQTQSSGPDMVVIPLAGLIVSSGSTLRVIGSRPLVLAVRGNVTVDGTIDANASGSTPGAGGNWSCGGSAGGNGSGSASFGAGGGGGGGGAFGTAGGRGGHGDNTSNEGAGGSARGTTNIKPLYGGCPGGNGGGCSSVGGAGGGAIQISVSGMLDVNGTIRANGAAGASGCSTEGGGAGGGSGGAILLEAGSRDTSGSTITANGGNGGDGNGLLNGSGSNGSTSSGSASSAGGDASGAGGGAGGGYGRVVK